MVLVPAFGSQRAGARGRGSVPVVVPEEPDPLDAGTITATAGDGTVQIAEGTAPSGGSESYTRDLYRSTTSGQKGSALASDVSLPYDDDTAENGTTYYYTLEVGDGESTDDTPQVSATPEAAPETNEPAGMTEVTSRAWNATPETGWSDRQGNIATLDIVTDATAPISPSNVGRCTFPADYPGTGTSSGCIECTVSINPTSRIYIRFGLKLSANWVGHASGTNKIFYMGHPIFLNAFGGGSNDLHFMVNMQGGESTNLSYNHASNEVSPTAAQAEIVRDQWREIEVLLELNTPGQANGSVHAWVDGVKTHQFTGNRTILAASGQYSEIDYVEWHPIWGGNSGTPVPADQYMYMDHTYVSTD